MLYEESLKPRLTEDLFKNPGSEYRGAPFWAWNCKLERSLLLSEIDVLKEMGMGGFHVHCRSGLETRYLGDEFIGLVKACNEKAKESGMRCWLYDEDRWPSGFAGGFVTANHRYRARFIVLSPAGTKVRMDGGFEASARAQRSGERTLLARYIVHLGSDGCLSGYRRVPEGETAAREDGENVWEAFLEVSGDSPWFNNQAYVNTLDKNAIRKFLEVTHERYYNALGKDFGKSIPAIFTDEPQFTHKGCLDFAAEKRDIFLPYTDDFEETFRKAYGLSLLDHLPELVWELPRGKVSRVRYCYHDHVSERFTAAFADTVGNWCRAHHLMLTGHMMDEPTLKSQTGALGEAMRSYRAFDLPGIDMLCDWREFTTAKQAQSAAHQYGRPGIMSEIYGVTNWDFDFRGHKLAGDWQAALGVTLRVHHLSWVSMQGEAKRDYPASIGYQSPWYKEYRLIEDHFARLNTALTRGKPRVRVGVIHPIESYWLHWGPREQTGEIRGQMDENFQNLVKWLLFGHVDFDFIAESLLPGLEGKPADGKMRVGGMRYEAVLVPDCETLRRTTLESLKRFRQAGGRVIFAGNPARYLDAAESDEVCRFAERCKKVMFNRTEILKALEAERDVEVRGENGARAENLLYQMREDGENRWLFLCHAYPMKNPDIAVVEKLRITVKGNWVPEVYDTLTGKTGGCDFEVGDGKTVIRRRFSGHDSLLLLLRPETPDSECKAHGLKTIGEPPELEGCEMEFLPEPETYLLSEPNVLLLDMADYAFDNGNWQPQEELLRIDNQFRRLLGYPLRMEALAQPWTMPDEQKTEHVLKLRFTIHSDIAVDGAKLALENPQAAELFVNGVKSDNRPDGWFVDQSIRTVSLPDLPAGKNRVELHIPFGRKTNVEWCYLLGDFGVSAAGRTAYVVRKPEALVYGDWAGQGLPFYAGNVTYEGTFVSRGGRTILEISHFRTPVIAVSIDGIRTGLVAFAPYLLDLDRLDAGEHRFSITAYGNRINAFGAVHNSDLSTEWFGPNAWRTNGSSWSYEYRLRQMGILTTPRIWTRPETDIIR